MIFYEPFIQSKSFFTFKLLVELRMTLIISSDLVPNLYTVSFTQIEKTTKVI